MPRFFGVLFDLGSTLLYFTGDQAQVFAGADQAVYDALKEAGFPPRSADFPALFRRRLQQYYINREVDLVERTSARILRELLAEEGYPDTPQEVIDTAMARMYAVSQAYWHIEHDAIETLQQLQARGYRLGVISNAANRQDVSTLVKNSGLAPYLDFVLTSAESGKRKPDPSIFRHGLDHWGISPDEVVMVGDRLRPDILGAQQIGIYSVWITRRAGSPENEKYAGAITPDAQISTLSELPALLDALETELHQRI